MAQLVPGVVEELEDQAPVQEGFRAPILRGLAWKTVTRVTFELTKLAVAVALAWLLTPREYGLAGMVLVLVAFEPVLSGVALASALVQRKEVTEEDKSTVFWTVAGFGLACTLAGIALSGLAARFYGDREVQPLFAAMSCCFFLGALGVTQAHLLLREMSFRAMELRAMAGVVVGAVAAVVVALEGFGPWALVAQQLGAIGTSTLLLWVFSDWHPRFVYSRESFRELRGFAGSVSGTLMLFQLNQNTDRVLIGRYLGASALGSYALAYNIILVPFSRLASPLQEVLYPVFSRLQDDRERLATVWLRVVRLVAAVAVPAMLGLVVLAPEFVSAVFGSKWHDAAPVMRILACVGLLFVLQGLNSVVLQAVGRTRTLFVYSVISFVTGIASFIIGLRWGIVGVAACFAVVSAVMQPFYMSLTAKAVGVGPRECIGAVAGVLQASALVVAAVLLARHLLVAAGASPGLTVVAAALVGALVYIPACWWRAPEVISELIRLRGRRAAAVTAVP